MTSAAQVQANRSNAEKSTGPRTAEGKAVAAQNAVRHGLLAKEVVVRGEDPGEFELYRQQMLEELAPAGLMEETLAQRIVGLSWRLRRAERMQATAYDKIENQSERPQPVMASEDASKLLAFLVKENMRCPAPASPPPGRRAMLDFNQERVLDRLLVYERRIEHSLYRTMAELRKLRKEGGVSSLKSEVGRLGGFDAGPSSLDTSQLPLETSGEPPEGGTPNEGGDESCETKPISGGVSSVKSEVSRGEPVLPTSDRPAQGSTPNEDEKQSCKTNPIREPASAPKKTAAEPPRPRMYPNTAREMTYEFGLRRWVWTGYDLANKNSKQADAGRRP